MGEPVLRLVMPEGDDSGQAPGWLAAGQPGAAVVAPAQGATDEAVTGATPAATIPATEPWPAATDRATTAATNADPGTAAGPAADTAGDAAALPELQPIGRPMTVGERAARLARHWLTQARADVMRPGELAHAAWHGRPDSLAQVHEYAVSRAWVPDDYAGSLAPALGAFYSHTVAKGGTALGLGFIWIVQRALRLAVFLFVCGVLAGIGVIFG